MRLVANGPGIGDSMVLSALAHAWYLTHGESVELVANHGELHQYAEWVSGVLPWSMDYPRSFPQFDDPRVIQGEHIIEYMLKRLGIRPPLRDQLHLWYRQTSEEAAHNPEPWKEYFTIHVQPGPWTRNKDWPLDYWRELMVLLGLTKVFQLGGDGDPKISAADSRYLGAPLRTVMKVLRGSRLHFCPVTGTLHMVAAFPTDCVAIFGGREDPDIIGYPRHLNLRSYPPQNCAPCWLVKPCPHGHEHLGELRKPCMDMILPTVVFDLAKQRFPYVFRMDHAH